MANYAASVLEEAKLILNERFAAPEKRLKTPGVLGAFMKNSELAIPNLGSLRTAAARAEKGYFFNRTKRSNTTARAHNHTGAVGDSTEVAFSWTTYADKFQTSLKRSENNIFNDAQLLANEIENAFKNIYESADTAALAYLGTNKTLVNVATKNGVFDETTSEAFEIATSNIARFIQHAKSMLRQNYHNGGAELILDPVLFLEAEHYLNQAGANATNTAYQLAGINLWEAITLSDANFPKGAGYIIPEGTIGVVDWIPSKNRMGWGDYESYNGGYGTIVDPRTGLTMALHGYSQRADTSSAGGEVQDVTTEWEISVDLSFNNAPLTTADETTIFEIGIVDTPADA